MTPLDFIPLPTWRDLIDILFLTIVAYQLYLWFRGTRALRVLIGLVVLGGVYSVAKTWGLHLTTWVFQILWQVLLILLLILFQSEIRQVLEKVSPLRFLRTRKRVSRDVLAKDLAEVAFDLAGEGTGALIVVERDENPSEFLHAGQTIMALPEPVLMKSIFNHSAPSHDGALIVSSGRLTRMGCILPLSESENIPKQYGTRHRAALGLSERTDAVCIVVSEERHEVSTVVDGKIKTWEDPKSLISRLKDWLSLSEIPGPTFEGFAKKAFTKNWGPKIGALILVTIAWGMLASQREVETGFEAPIRYEGISSNLVLEKGVVKTVDLKLSGRRRTLNALDEKGVQVKVDLAKLPAGPHRIRLSAKNVDLPLGVKVIQFKPQDIRVVLKPLSSQDPPI